ncbi:DNA helicase [Vibrio phage 1.240.O._10N.261.52.F8]|nr:DNA helicase [Vibrio phage 1.240.O._10N.261.52.F8]
MAEIELYSNAAEQSVLGGCMYDNSLISQAKKLSANDFSVITHRRIFETIVNLHDDGRQADAISVDEAVDKFDGSYSYLMELYRAFIPSVGITGHVASVLDFSLRRKLRDRMNEVIGGMHKTRAIDIVNELQPEINNIAERTSVGDVLGIDDLIELSMDKMEASNKDMRVGIGTGYEEIDERLGYKMMAFGEITALGALSKNGKTLFMNSIAASCDLQGSEVSHVFSIEMPLDAMFNSVVSAMTGVPADFYCRQSFYSEHYKEAYDAMFGKWGAAVQRLSSENKITFDGKKDVDVNYICAEMKKTAAIAESNGKKLKLVFIDHFHRMNFNTGSGSMTYAMRDAVRMIKNTAADLGVAVVLLVQLNNRAENDNPTSFHILDSSSVRHELQCFIGTRLFRQDGRTVFGVFFDSQRFASLETKFDPVYMELKGGRLVRVTDFIPHIKE